MRICNVAFISKLRKMKTRRREKKNRKRIDRLWNINKGKGKCKKVAWIKYKRRGMRRRPGNFTFGVLTRRRLVSWLYSNVKDVFFFVFCFFLARSHFPDAAFFFEVKIKDFFYLTSALNFFLFFFWGNGEELSIPGKM